MKNKTVAEIIEETDYLKPNNYARKDKIGWLQDLEHRIIDEIVQKHYCENDIEKEELTNETELIASGAHSDVYRLYIAAQIDRYNEEYDRYNNNMALFNGAYRSFELMWHSTHMPISIGGYSL